MSRKRIKIVVVEENINVRIAICTWLSKEGYAVFECKDSYNAIRLIRKLIPDLVISSTDLRGINPKLLLEIVENDQLSHVLFTTKQNNNLVKRLIRNASIKTICLKPLDQHNFLKHVKGTLLMLSHSKAKATVTSKKRINDQQDSIIQRAKEILMEKWYLSEEQAHVYLRKKSMDLSIPMLVLAKKIILSVNKRHEKD